MKKHIISLMIIAICLCGIAAVILLNHLIRADEQFENDVRIEINGEISDKLEVNDLVLIPGEKTEYTVKLMCLIEGTYDVSMVFAETKPSPLKNFADVEIRQGEQILATGSLAELFSGTPVEFACELRADSYTDITICFKMPLDVGNDAKGVTADFDVDLTVKIKLEEE